MDSRVLQVIIETFTSALFFIQFLCLFAHVKISSTLLESPHGNVSRRRHSFLFITGLFYVLVHKQGEGERKSMCVKMFISMCLCSYYNGYLHYLLESGSSMN